MTAADAHRGPIPRSDFAPGTVIAGRYRVVREIGRGGMGIVLLAEHVALGTPAAIKVLAKDVATQSDMVARFLQEARAAASLRSEFVARVTDFGTLDDDSPFMVLEYLEGEDLSATLARGMAAANVVDAVIQACAGLAEAHAKGIVHRDIKPSNLFVTRRPDGSTCVKVLDFGISKLVSGPSVGEAATTTEMVLGTPLYMSPEHVRGSKNIDARTDVWSLGVILYEGLAGRRPFHGGSLGELFALVLERDAPPLEGVPAGLAKVVQRCLARHPDQRLPDVGALAAALEPFASPEGRAAVARARTTPPAFSGTSTTTPELADARAVGTEAVMAPTLGASVLAPRDAAVSGRSLALSDEARGEGSPGEARSDAPSGTSGRRSAFVVGLVAAAVAIAIAIAWGATRPSEPSAAVSGEGPAVVASPAPSPTADDARLGAPSNVPSVVPASPAPSVVPESPAPPASSAPLPSATLPGPLGGKRPASPAREGSAPPRAVPPPSASAAPARPTLR